MDEDNKNQEEISEAKETSHIKTNICDCRNMCFEDTVAEAKQIYCAIKWFGFALVIVVLVAVTIWFFSWR